jgi:hypothetical protein
MTINRHTSAPFKRHRAVRVAEKVQTLCERGTESPIKYSRPTSRVRWFIRHETFQVVL